MGRTLAVRLDSDGDVLLTGPAVRALARLGNPVDLLASPSGAAAARLLPDVDEVLEYSAPWSGFRPPPVDRETTEDLVDALAARGYDLAVVFTSFHQSPLPMALLARLAGIDRVVATSEDYPGSLLDVRHRRADPPGGGHEVEAACALAVAAGAPEPAAADLRLAVRRPLPQLPAEVSALPDGFVALHPGASVPSRGLTAEHAGALAAGLAAAGRPVVLTGGPGERELTAAARAAAREAAPDGTVLDLAGRTDLPGLAAVLDAAACVVVGNTGPAHLAAAVGTPVVSLFSPVVPPERWAPWGVPVVLLGDQGADCRGSRARDCPVPGHPCLSSVPPAAVLAAVEELVHGAPGALATVPEPEGGRGCAS
ncbi:MULTISPECIES: glycosyltransferase family 9 protein [Kocuria]|uniref:glycosyltransferase family 9 protein n=1 Tax=Kocuria TaxID=57493 RepID=UPI00037AB341|nr:MULTISPECIES: glycosyltransferase family 9 protein [Kocuria]EYT48168.1 glycosyl transferase [Kocuria sp. UCD-OTCP]STX05464.1 Lipopolysaccharide core heptosyltransferase rfaQ [Kocuria rosea]VEH43016.1 Lipopolysaccharide core heptosyltransferase rfaQ [Kocuria rosea]